MISDARRDEFAQEDPFWFNLPRTDGIVGLQSLPSRVPSTSSRQAKPRITLWDCSPSAWTGLLSSRDSLAEDPVASCPPSCGTGPLECSFQCSPTSSMLSLPYSPSPPPSRCDGKCERAFANCQQYHFEENGGNLSAANAQCHLEKRNPEVYDTPVAKRCIDPTCTIDVGILEMRSPPPSSPPPPPHTPYPPFDVQLDESTYPDYYMCGASYHFLERPHCIPLAFSDSGLYIGVAHSSSLTFDNTHGATVFRNRIENITVQKGLHTLAVCTQPARIGCTRRGALPYALQSEDPFVPPSQEELPEMRLRVSEQNLVDGAPTTSTTARRRSSCTCTGRASRYPTFLDIFRRELTH